MDSLIHQLIHRLKINNADASLAGASVIFMLVAVLSPNLLSFAEQHPTNIPFTSAQRWCDTKTKHTHKII